MNDINVVIQSYNYGGGYADYVAKNGKKHSFNLADNFAKNKSGGIKVTYTNPIAVSKNGGWRYNYGNMFYVELVNQYLTVKQSGTNDFTVAYEVDQQVKEGEQTQAVAENYTVTVHVDKDGAMVITQNPTLAPAVQKSKYEPKVQEADVSVSSDTVKDATAFLETFFKLYPTATEKELAYYVKDGVLAPVSGDYVFSELVNPVFTKNGDNLNVSVSVKYLDNKSKMTQISQYELVLHKDDNWKIVE